MTIIIIIFVVVIVIIMVVLAPHIMNHRGSKVHVVLVTPHIMNHRGSVVQVMLVVPCIMNHRSIVVHVMFINPVDSIPSWHSIHGTAGSSVHSMGRVGIGWPGDQATDRSVDGSMGIPGDI